MVTKKKKTTQIWDFSLEDVEKDVDSLIRKYRNPAFISSSTVITNIGQIPERGFFLMMVSRKDDKVTIRQFGQDIDADTVEDAFMQIMKGFHALKEFKNIGLA